MLTDSRKKRFQNVLSNRLCDVVVLENIHDPHNAMAVIRNCDAFGIQTVHVVFETEKQFNPEKLGKTTSASAHRWVDMTTWNSSFQCINTLKKKGYWIISTIIDKKAKKLTGYHFPNKKVALVFGNEGYGISEICKKNTDELLYIPMYGFVDSINLSVSAGITLYELSKQRRLKKSKMFTLSTKEQIFLQKKWTDIEIKRKMRL